jgi:L-iditol 2-dehydrogenase
MLAAVMTAPEALAPQELPTPEPGRGEVLVRVGANTLCATDTRILRGEKTAGVELPIVLGHETAGHVAAVGAGVSGFPEGAPVAMSPVIPCLRCPDCRRGLENICPNSRIMGYAHHGGLAEYMLVPARAIEAGCLFVSPTDLPSEQLALAEPLACVVLGQRWSPIALDDTVLVLGAGPIGLLHLQVARANGAGRVIVSEPSPGRREHARRLGAARTVDPTTEDLAEAVAELTGGEGVDAVIIAIGVPALLGDALKLCRKGGRVNVFAGFKGTGLSEVEANLLHYRQIRLTGSANSRRADFQTALSLVANGVVDTGSMVTHRFPLADVTDALAKVGADDAVKVAVLP